MTAYDAIHGPEDQESEGQPHGWIQWKGTDVCIDLHCGCGHHGHVDGEFFYGYECVCGRKYAVGQIVRLIEIPEVHWAEWEQHHRYRQDT